MGVDTGKGEVSYTTSKLARMFNVAPNSIKNWENSGIIPKAERTPGNHRRYTAVHVEALKKFFSTGAQPKPTDSPQSVPEASNGSDQQR